MEEIYKVVRGSHAYGTNIETSDIDYARVHILKLDELLGLRNRYEPQINYTDDDVSYEVGRFIELCAKGNPNMLELLFSTDKNILIKNPIMDRILEKRNIFITKICKNSFAGYARTQFKKAENLDKKYRWELDDKNSGFTKRKNVLDFCYIIENDKSIELKDFLKTHNINHENIGLARIPHVKNQYNMYYSTDPNLVYRGVCTEESNDVRLSSIPKGQQSIGLLYFNLEAY